jgi:hypothetical protein
MWVRIILVFHLSDDRGSCFLGKFALLVDKLAHNMPNCIGAEPTHDSDGEEHKNVRRTAGKHGWDLRRDKAALLAGR